MTILFICTDSCDFAGAAKSLLNLINSLGNNIRPIVLFSHEGTVSKIFQDNGIRTIIYPFPDIFQEKKRLLTLLHHPTRSAYLRYFKENWICAKYVATLLKDETIDIVHTNTSICTVGIEISRRLKARHIWHIRELLDIHFSEPILISVPILRRIINRYSDARICISEAVRKHWHCKSENTYVLHDAIQKSANDNICKQKEKYILACAHQLHDSKGIDQAVLAFAQSGIADNGYSLKLIGQYTEEYRAKLLDIAKRYHCEEALLFEGYQQDVAPYFQKAAAFLMCSKNEGLGRVTAEAMLAGCPVIAHASGGTLDLIRHNDTGYLFNTIDECAHLIKHVVTSNQDKTIDNALLFANENFLEESYGKKVLDIYKRTLSQ